MTGIRARPGNGQLADERAAVADQLEAVTGAGDELGTRWRVEQLAVRRVAERAPSSTVRPPPSTRRYCKATPATDHQLAGTGLTTRTHLALTEHAHRRG